MTTVVFDGHARYTGLRPWLDDPVRRSRLMAFTLLTECLADPRTPFGAMARNGTLLNEETEEFLYNDYRAMTPHYRTGTHPLLENYLDRVVDDEMDDAQKVIALNNSIGDLLPTLYPPSPVFLYGESDEETILKGGGHCSCRARLLTALCQILDLPARPVLFWTWEDPARKGEILGGHTVAEIMIDGNWSFFDPMCHLYCRRADGRFASILEIRQDKKLLLQMPADVVKTMTPMHYSYCQPGEAVFESYWNRFFHPLSPIAISRHHVGYDYTIRWNWATEEFRQKLQKDGTVLRKVVYHLAEKDELPEDIYRLNLQDFRQYIGIDKYYLEPILPEPEEE